MSVPEIMRQSATSFYPIPYAEDKAHPDHQIENHFNCVGCQVSGCTYQELTLQLEPDERLVAQYWTCTSGTGDFAPLIDSQATFDYFEEHVVTRESLLLRWRRSFRGEYNRLGFWALPESEVVGALEK